MIRADCLQNSAAPMQQHIKCLALRMASQPQRNINPGRNNLFIYAFKAGQQFSFATTVLASCNTMLYLHNKKCCLVCLLQNHLSVVCRSVQIRVREYMQKPRCTNSGRFCCIADRQGRKKILQLAKTINRIFLKCKKFVSWPVTHICHAAKKATGFMPFWHGVRNGAIGIKIIERNTLQQHNHINVTVFCSLAPPVTSLNPKITQPYTKCLLQLRQKLGHPCVCINHRLPPFFHTFHKDN